VIPAPVARLLHTLAGLAPDGATARVPVPALAELGRRAGQAGDIFVTDQHQDRAS
jgi:hypothetical protein